MKKLTAREQCEVIGRGCGLVPSGKAVRFPDYFHNEVAVIAALNVIASRRERQEWMEVFWGVLRNDSSELDNWSEWFVGWGCATASLKDKAKALYLFFAPDGDEDNGSQRSN